MKLHEIRQLDDDGLDARLREIEQELFNLRFQQQTGRLTNTARPGQLRKEYARIKTVLYEREFAQTEDGR